MPHKTNQTSWKKGKSGNPKGRPPKEKTLKALLNDNPRNKKLLKKLYDIAMTLGTKNEHKEAVRVTNILLNKIVPDLKSTELEVNQTIQGYVVLPEGKKYESIEGEIISQNVQDSNPKTLSE